MDKPAVIPGNLFGSVPETFYADLGRVAMLAALLDQRLQDLYVQMHHSSQTDQAGAYGSELIRVGRTRLDVFPADQRDRVAGFFEAALDALNRRNAVLHSLWRFDGHTETGWRYPRTKKNETSKMVELETSEVPRLITDLVTLNENWQSVMALVLHSKIK